ncbi:hypothetical protein E0765_06065 [Sulfuricurvum sp. IAE1]|uniref:hypothetical protein n=1 Tax=Sulfuricurvum sp. IAE1 TaxID=2546102 RepID=UPI0010501C94|nr:hypothetical protein [Sulfuricurvum sp. IAE1]TDA64277.1 hypothetical protein E0765_06065 [Sulfuricurvum sp. IAE1]
MALFTTMAIALEIDGITFNVTVSNLKKEQQDTLKEKYGSYDAEFKERSENEAKLGRMIERYQLLKADGQNQSALDLLDQIEAIEAKIAPKNIEETEKMLNEMYQSRFLMTVSGTDKERLKGYVDEHNIGYLVLVKEIEQMVAEAKKGKSKG